MQDGMAWTGFIWLSTASVNTVMDLGRSMKHVGGGHVEQLKPQASQGLCCIALVRQLIIAVYL